jgi:hypothetical protein
MFWPMFDLRDPLDRLGVEDVAADAVTGVGWVADDTATF